MPEHAEREVRPGLPLCPRMPEAPAFLLEELSSADRKSFETHCSDCPACRAALADFRRVMDVMVESQPSGTLARDLSGRVLAEVRRGEGRGDRSASAARLQFLRRPLVRLAAGLALAAGVAAVLRSVWPEAPGRRASPAAAVAASASGQAIDQALAWMARAQETSGAWDCAKWQGRPEYEVGLTGLALLTFLRGGGVPDGGGHSEVVQRGLEYLVRQQDAAGAFGPAGSGRMYNHGIATVVLLEAYRQGEDARLLPPIARAIDFIRAEQLDSGGWGYAKREGEQANTSVSVWQLHALQLARAEGIADTTPAYRRGLRWIGGVVDGEGCFGYERRGDFPSGSDTLTAMGAFCLLSAMPASEASAPEVQRMARALHAVVAKGGQGTDFYRWFFLAHALKAAGDPTFQEPLDRLRRSLVAMRQTDGAHAGSWEPAGMWSAVGGRIFTTAMATLALQADRAIPRA